MENYKRKLITLCASRSTNLPYFYVDVEHNSRHFVARCVVESNVKVTSYAKCESAREAEQIACKRMLESLEFLAIEDPSGTRPLFITEEACMNYEESGSNMISISKLV